MKPTSKQKQSVRQAVSDFWFRVRQMRIDDKFELATRTGLSETEVDQLWSEIDEGEPYYDE